MATFYNSVFRLGSLPLLERSQSFHFQRNKVLANNIANLETPYYKRRDLSEASFQKMLARSIQERERKPVRTFDVIGNGDNYVTNVGGLGVVEKTPGSAGILRHDENNVSIEQEMSELAKNALALRGRVALYKKQLNQISEAIRESQRV